MRRIIDAKLDELSGVYKDIKQDYYKAVYNYRKNKGHYSTPEVIAKRREYLSRPDVATRIKERHQSQEYRDKRQEYRRRPEIIARSREYQRNWKSQRKVQNNDNKTRKNENSDIRARVIKYLTEKFGKEEQEIERILNHRGVAGLAEPEIEVKNEYRKEYRKYLRILRKQKLMTTSNMNDDLDDYDDDEMLYEGGARKSAKKKNISSKTNKKKRKTIRK